MADFSNIIQEINDDINTNGVGAITGAKLNEVLRDMIAAVNAGKQDPLTIDATPTEDSTNPVQSGGVYEALDTLVPRASLFGGFITNAATPNPGDIRRYFLTNLSEELPNFDYINLPDNGKWKIVRWNPRDAGWDYETIDCYTSAQIDQLLGEVSAAIAQIDQFHGEVSAAIEQIDQFLGEVSAAISDKQDTISDLAAIRSGASAGATAVQPSDLATVATSGSYNDLLNKPTIPAAQVQSDWNEADNTKVDYIKNKPTIPDVSGKADKVNGATNGDFAGLDGNGNLVDTGYNEDDFSLKVVFFDVSTTPSSMLPNKVYRFGTLSGDTTFPAFTDAPSGDTEVKIWCWTFTTPSTAPTITWPAGITSWAGGSAPTINASKNYEVSVMDGLACIVES